MTLKNKRILITAGPTWVAIDSVRVISNIATGETGVLLAEKLSEAGAKVTLVLGPVGACCLNRKIKLIKFKFFDELKNIITKEISSTKYNILIHSAAVSDYKPLKSYNQKVKSGKKLWQLKLTQTPKLIDLIKKCDPSLILVGFKFEPKARKDILMKRAKNLLDHAHLDLIVANTIFGNLYKAYIMNHNRTYGPVFNKKQLAEKLINLIGGELWKN